MKKLYGGIIGSGKNSFIGLVHRASAALNGEAEITAGIFSSDSARSAERGTE